MMLNSTIIGNKIADARKKINLSQAELANKISISPQAVGKWERGESMPDFTTLNRLAEIFGLDLNYFSDTFKSATNDEHFEKQSIKLPTEQLNEEGKKRFDWNWDMSNSNWVDADFSGLKNLKDKFSSSNIKNCKFIKSDLSGLILKGNAIAGCDFSHSDIRNGKIYASVISKSTFIESSLIDAEIQQSEIKNCNFDNSNLSGAEFMNSIFQKNSIESAVLKHTSFKKIGFTEITFGGIIEDCSFENCFFKDVKFENATILNSFFKHNRKFNKVQFIDCKVDKLTFAFLKSNGAKMVGIAIIEENSTDKT
ncbi:helix-turn-helix domain-containing protein [Algoriphagus pacificus]|uniref:Pentapeptide repeat-containing protein n=1 Tax=Algoriphagus pacificus TaxID=2811234 RepID=A0ABS3CK79_9BACT|nr:pentapeptide repeat-containing protein [Algoriphagus pacificus]MBN7817490.1 pentapeptide repeat-containing protein [Algoriphagus pacificus]